MPRHRYWKKYTIRTIALPTEAWTGLDAWAKEEKVTRNELVKAIVLTELMEARGLDIPDPRYESVA